jgi:hypothetical protein
MVPNMRTSSDAVVAEMAALLARLGALAADPAPADADRIDRNAVLEQLRGPPPTP